MPRLHLDTGASSDQIVTIGGHRLKLTNLDKVLYAETGTTKADVLSYYVGVADVLIRYAEGRPATRKRWVNGVGTTEDPGQVFFQKNLDDSTPTWVSRGTIAHKDRVNEYPLVNDVATLAWLGQIAALEIHVPQWRFSATGGASNPDRLVLDLDPGEGAGLAECAEVARYARTILTGMGLDPMPVTSGSKGIHLYAALDGTQTSAQVSAVAHELARALEADHPDLVVSSMKKADRRGKVLVDWSQNNAAKTTITPYSLRGRSRPLVAAPRTWRELDAADLAQLDYRDVLARTKRGEDPLATLASGPDVVDSSPTADAEATVSGGDRLAAYRDKRDATKTPEPVPTGTGRGPEGRTFVIQEHHARRLHYDLRLEREGVLVSWALPKGVPTDTTKNHLAVQTEDHPLEYGGFEGSIPKGEYGAGEVTIWDAGTYELEKWRDDKEVIATLHGRPDGGLAGPTRIALIHTGGAARAASNWLIHRMRDPTPRATPPANGASAESSTPSERPTASAGRYDPVAPMLATVGTPSRSFDEGEWAFEMKWDGLRAIAHLGADTDDVRLLTRNGNDVTLTYPEIADQMRASVGEGAAVLDGEIVALNSLARPDFGLLQSRMGVTRPAEVALAARNSPVQYLVFDLLRRGDTTLLDAPYDERRRQLFALVHSRGPIHVPPAFDGTFADAVSASRELQLEGIVAKRRESPYLPGRRSPAWVKIKHHHTQEVVVGGWRPGKRNRSGGIGSLLLGIPDEEGLRYVGRVGTGFTERELTSALERLTPMRATTSPFYDIPRADSADAVWVRATLVGEVEFAGWTASGRLRQPSWRGWRPDKEAADVVVESS